MWTLRSTGTLCDVTVQVDCEGELEEFEAHQVVLAASSGYFKSRLLSSNQGNKIFLCDITPSTFAKFLEYVYFGKIEVDRGSINVVLQTAKLLDCQDLADACELLGNAARIERSDVSDACQQKEGMDLSTFATQVKMKEEPLKRAAKRKKPFKVPEKLEKETDQDVQSRRSRRLAGRRVSVDFPTKRLKTQTDTSDESDTEEAEQAFRDPESQDVSGETPGEKEACDDSGTESPHSAPEEDPQESDFQPNEEMDEADEEEKEPRKGSSKYRCEKCSRSFYYEKSYLKHLKVNHGVQTDTTLRCDVCQQTFRNRCNLKIHQRHVHSDERLFSCDICSKTFKRKKDVTRHRRQVHEGGTDRHYCHICGKSLSSKTALTLHERTHSGHKPFKCDECGSSFAQSSALKTHQR